MLALSLLAAVPAEAQRYPGSRPGSGSAASRVQLITRVINDCEDRTDDFRKSLRRALNDSRLDRTQGERELNRKADQLERALDRVGKSWNKDRDISKTRRYTREAIDAGRDIDKAVRVFRLNRDTERDWSVVRTQLNILARSFDLAELR